MTELKKHPKQNKQTTLISPVEALSQPSAESFIVAPNFTGTNPDLTDTALVDTTIPNAGVDPIVVSSEMVDSAISDSEVVDNKATLNTLSTSTQSASIFSQRQGFRLNNYNLMVKFEDGNQISEVPSIYPLPNAPRWFLGMSNINGQTIPVFNLKEYFGIADHDKDNQQLGHEWRINDKTTLDKKTPMLFVIQQGNNATGIIIDGLLERLDINDSKLQPNINLPNKLQHCIHDTYLLNKELWYDLDCLDFLDEIEKQVAS